MRVRRLLPGDERATRVDGGKLLDRDAEAHVVAPLPTERGRTDDAQDAGGAHLADGLARQRCGLVPTPTVRLQLALGELAHVRAPNALLGREREVEGHSCLAWLR